MLGLTDPLPRALSESDLNRPGDPCIPNYEDIQCEEQLIATQSAQEPTLLPAIVASAGTCHRLDQLERGVLQLSAVVAPDTTVTFKNTVPPLSMTADDRLLRLENILNELTVSLQSKQNSCPLPKEPDTKQKQIETSKITSEKIKKKKIYIPFNDKLLVSNTFTRFYNIRFPVEDKRKINPYSLRNEITQLTGCPPKQLSTSGPDSFVVEVLSAEQGNKIIELNHVKNIECKCEKHRYLNQSKGLIYLYEYDIDDLTEFTDGLQENYKILSVENATFIKSRSEHTTVFLITFDEETLPESIYIQTREYTPSSINPNSAGTANSMAIRPLGATKN